MKIITVLFLLVVYVPSYCQCSPTLKEIVTFPSYSSYTFEIKNHQLVDAETTTFEYVKSDFSDLISSGDTITYYPASLFSNFFTLDYTFIDSNTHFLNLCTDSFASTKEVLANTPFYFETENILSRHYLKVKKDSSLGYKTKVFGPEAYIKDDSTGEFTLYRGTPYYQVAFGKNIGVMSGEIYYGEFLRSFRLLDANGVKIYSSINSISDFDKNKKINIYPNPSSSEIYVDTKLDLTHLAAINSLGETVIVSSNSHYLDLSKLPNGIYYIEATAQNGTYRKRVLKQ